MRGGSNRIPTKLHELRGTNRASRERHTPEVKALKRRAPRWLSPGAKDVWRYMVGCFPDGLLGNTDLPALAMMCTHVSVAIEAAKVVCDEGIMVSDGDHKLPDGTADRRKHPALQVLRDNSAAFKSYASLFGLTPVDRGRLDLPAPPASDLLERILSMSDEQLETMKGESDDERRAGETVG